MAAKKKLTRLQAAKKKAKETNALKQLILADFEFDIPEFHDFEILEELSKPNSNFYRAVCEVLENREKALQVLGESALLDILIMLSSHVKTAKGPSISAIEKLVNLIGQILKIPELSGQETNKNDDNSTQGGVMIVQEFPSAERWEEIAKKNQLKLVQKVAEKAEESG